MKLALLLALTADRKEAIVVAAPAPFDVALADFKSQVAAGDDAWPHPRHPVAELWTSSGVRKTHKFRPSAAPAPVSDAGAGSEGGESPATKPLEDWTVEDLRAYAKERAVSFPSKADKAAVIAAIRAAGEDPLEIELDGEGEGEGQASDSESSAGTEGQATP